MRRMTRKRGEALLLPLPLPLQQGWLGFEYGGASPPRGWKHHYHSPWKTQQQAQAPAALLSYSPQSSLGGSLLPMRMRRGDSSFVRPRSAPGFGISTGLFEITGAPLARRMECQKDCSIMILESKMWRKAVKINFPRARSKFQGRK